MKLMEKKKKIEDTEEIFRTLPVAGYEVPPGACLPKLQRRQGFRGGFCWQIWKGAIRNKVKAFKIIKYNS